MPHPGRVPPGMTRRPLYRPGGHQVRSGRMRKISPPPAFDPRTVQPGTSRFTGYAIPTQENARAIWITALPTASYACADNLFLPYLHRRRYILQTKAETRFRAYRNNNEYTDSTQYLRRCELNTPSIWFFNFFSVSAEKRATNYVTKKTWRYCLTFKNRASYIWDRRTATLQMLHFIYIFNKYRYWEF